MLRTAAAIFMAAAMPFAPAYAQALMAGYEDGWSVVVLSNVQSGMQGAWGPDFGALLAGETPSKPLPLRPFARRAPLAELAGDYRNPSGGYTLHLRVAKRRLEMAWGPLPTWRPVSVIGEDEMFAMADYTRMRVQCDAAGRIAAVVLCIGWLGHRCGGLS